MDAQFAIGTAKRAVLGLALALLLLAPAGHAALASPCTRCHGTTAVTAGAGPTRGPFVPAGSAANGERSCRQPPPYPPSSQGGGAFGMHHPAPSAGTGGPSDRQGAIYETSGPHA